MITVIVHEVHIWKELVTEEDLKPRWNHKRGERQQHSIFMIHYAEIRQEWPSRRPQEGGDRSPVERTREACNTLNATCVTLKDIPLGQSKRSCK